MTSNGMGKKIDKLLSAAPQLKARQIAKELGSERKAINAFLHRHPEKYRQDGEYRWELITGAELVLTLPTGWITADAFEETLRDAGPTLNGSSNLVKIVFSQGSKAMVDCTARMLSLVNQLVHRGGQVTIDFTQAESTRTYLDRAGFFDLLDENVVVLPNRPQQSAAERYKGNSDTLVEFGAVDPGTQNEELIAQLTRKFVQQSSTAYEIAAFTIFGELIGNVTEHSETPLQGFAGLQRYKGRDNHIQTVVSDSGIGIAKTLRPALRQYYPDLYKQFGNRSLESDVGLVSIAMSKGQISRYGCAHGLGFKSSREQAVKFDASFSVRQERFCLKFKLRDGDLVEIEQQRKLHSLWGTHICFDFFVD